MLTTRRLWPATAALAIAVAGCSSPASHGEPGGSGPAGTPIAAQQKVTDPTAKGPAAEVPGAKKGGTITVQGTSAGPGGGLDMALDPTNLYYTDTNEIAKLLFRTPTQFKLVDGRPVLVPDLTDLGTVSADKLTWTFHLQPGIKYEDGAEVKVEDLAYAIKRSFAHDLYNRGPAYQLSFFKGGDTYKGPYTGGDSFPGVETQGSDTLVIHLAKPFTDLPFYMSFPMFTPIPQAKDTKSEYQRHPLATGPYKFTSYQAEVELKLEKNPNWDPKTDPVRHQYPDGWVFQWGGDPVKNQQQILNGQGPATTTISTESLDATLIPQLQGGKKEQLVQGDSPCTYGWQLDTRKIPLEVRKAIAKAYPYDQIFKAAGDSAYTAERASTIIPPSVPGYRKYPALPDLAGTGTGDPAAAKAMLAAAGKTGFEVSWYYDNEKTIPQQVNQIRTQAFEAAGFTVRAIGVSSSLLGTRKSDYAAPVNMGQGPGGWCSDWPTGGSWLPVLFESHSIADGVSWGMLQDPALDAEIDAVAALPAEESTPKWAALDEKIMGMYAVLPITYDKMALVQGTGLGPTKGDATMGMPYFLDMFVK